MNYFIIGDEDTVLGFGMVGVTGRVATTEADAAAAFDAAIANAEVGILVVTERVADFIRPRVDHLSFSESFPLILEIPDRRGRIPGKPSIRELVNTAIGIKLG